MRIHRRGVAIRRIAIAIALALAAFGGWWGTRGRPIPTASPISRETAPDAALADDRGRDLSAKRAASQAVVAASAASGAQAMSDDEHCGLEDGPAFAPAQMRDGMIVADQTKAVGPTWTATQTRIDGALRGSAEPFDHAIADLLNVGDMRTPDGLLDALVQDASATHDARVYALAFRACYTAAHTAPGLRRAAPPASCASLTARQWASLDPDNGVPWLAVLAQADEAGDAAAMRDALAHLVAATRFDDGQYQASAEVLSHAPTEGANEFAIGDLSNKAWGSLTQFGLGPLATLCRNGAGGDAVLANQCAGIATTLFDRSDSWSLRIQAASLTRYMTGDETRRKAVRAERAAIDARRRAGIPTSTCGFLRYQFKQTLRAGQIGEIAAAREEATPASGP